jgi:hypothetical protein
MHLRNLATRHRRETAGSVAAQAVDPRDASARSRGSGRKAEARVSARQAMVSPGQPLRK